MTLATACVLIACLLPIACAGLAKSGGMGKPRRDGGFDNHNPRAWMSGLEGWHARANAAQQNSFEALPIFIAGVVLAQQAGAPQLWVNMLAGAFIVLRIGYIAAYVSDKASIRSLFWAAAMACAIGLFLTTLL
jgi:uncharacterized MAPEG superfamily protein